MVKNFEDLQQVSKENVEVAMKSAESLSKGAQAIATEVADYSKKAFEDGSAMLEKLCLAQAQELTFDKARLGSGSGSGSGGEGKSASSSSPAVQALAALPGVGRKTANVVLGNAFGQNEGVVVDTHVSRLSQRLGLTKFPDPVRIERDLIKIFPRPRWTDLSHWLIFHGRRRCMARKPDCANCELNDICPSAEKME